MISNSFVNKRHIPEEELHAYLDQALSRSQCVEIESHLAVCAGCRGERDAIAALRDRTTALLSTLAPATIHTPPFGELQQRHFDRSAKRQLMVRRSAWAASVILALGFGWTARELAPTTGTQAGSVPAAPPIVVATQPADSEPTLQAGSDESESPVLVLAATPEAPVESGLTVSQSDFGQPPVEDALLDGLLTQQPLVAQPRLEVTSSLLSADDELTSGGMWRSLSWSAAQEGSGEEWIPRVEGLPIVEVQVKPSSEDKPLMVVSQRLSTGEMIRTFSGPVADISELLSHQPGQSVTASLQVLGNDDSLNVGGGLGPRASGAEQMLAIQGSVSVDSLRTLLLRLR
jgi:hypothetical protein